MTFGPRGTELWAAMQSSEMGPAHRVLLIEACRLADRLDRFEDVLSGGYWFFAKVSEENPDQAEIVIDNVLSEARQHAAALKTIVTELEPKPKGTAAPAAPKVPTGLASLTERIEKRKRSTGA